MPKKTNIADLKSALIFGLREYLRRTQMNQVVVGISGGIDSAVVAALAAEAINPDHVRLVSMPTTFNSTQTQHDAKLLAQHLGARFHAEPIDDIRTQVSSAVESISGTALTGMPNKIFRHAFEVYC